MKVLVAVAVGDYITAVISSAINHKLSSKVGFKGILKKAMMFCIVLMIYVVTESLTGSYDMYIVTLSFYTINELISILENVEKAGVPLPDKLVSMIKVLEGKKDENS